MFAACVIALLCLGSVSHSAPLACEDLLRPLDGLNPHHLDGRWALVAGVVSDPAQVERLKTRDSASINFANASDASKTYFTRNFAFGDSCQYLRSNVSLQGGSFTFDEFNLTVTFIYTSCPDCVVMRFENESNEVLRFYLFSRRREVGQEEMQEVGAQAQCLNMLPPVVMDPTKELCPDQAPGGDEKTDGQKA